MTNLAEIYLVKMTLNLDRTIKIEDIVKILDDNTRVNKTIIHKEDPFRVFFEAKGFIVRDSIGGDWGPHFNGYHILEKKEKIYEIAYVDLNNKEAWVWVYGGENMDRLSKLLVEYNENVKDFEKKCKFESENDVQNKEIEGYSTGERSFDIKLKRSKPIRKFSLCFW